MQLRPYQSESIEAVFEFWNENAGNCLIDLPTGTGKSVVVAETCRRCLAWPGTKILVVTHVRELVRQNYDELMGLWPDAPAGINSAGLGRRETSAAITFCSIQSVYKQAHKFDRVDIILIDEAHLIPRKDSTTYRRFLRDLRTINPYIKVVGLTATPYRLDSGRLDQGDDRMFDAIAYSYNIRDAISAGYLSPLITKDTDLHLDTSGVGTRGGEFIPSELQSAVDTEAANNAAVKEAIEYGRDRASWLFFCSGVEHARNIRDTIRRHGYSCETIDAKTPKVERDDIIARFKRGEIRALASMNVLTTGFNATGVDLIALLRPTKSAGLYVQMIGRGTRLHPGKKNCIILDFAGNIARFGPVDTIGVDNKRKGDEPGEAPIKTCPECASVVHAAIRECPDCGFEFPKNEVKVEQTASALPILSTQQKPTWLRVDGITYSIHRKLGAPNSLKVSYRCGLATYMEWVCLEHEGFARTKAQNWWLRRSGNQPVPDRIEGAISRTGELTEPAEILVRQNGKYHEVSAIRGLRILPQTGARARIRQAG